MTTAKTGCTVCGTERTETLDGVCGRRCAEHPPKFSPRHAVDLAISLGPAAATTYIRTDLP